VTEFTNGPAAGVVLTLRRAPLFLRVVQDSVGNWDALDQVSDLPGPEEKLYAYRRSGDAGNVHLQRQDPKTGRRMCGWFVCATYEVVEQPPHEVLMRSALSWQAWATARALLEAGA
jgi:hypothetical protein